jgi:hypothetical protein
MIRGKIMKNEREENEVLGGPLILLAPASNLVAILTLNWWDSREPRGCFRKSAEPKLSGKSPEKSRVQNLDIDTSRGIDHNVISTG